MGERESEGARASSDSLGSSFVRHTHTLTHSHTPVDNPDTHTIHQLSLILLYIHTYSKTHETCHA
jgi:hypothetical protein